MRAVESPQKGGGNAASPGENTASGATVQADVDGEGTGGGGAVTRARGGDEGGR